MASTGPDIAQRERLKNSANYDPTVPVPPAATFVLIQVCAAVILLRCIIIGWQ